MSHPKEAIPAIPEHRQEIFSNSFGTLKAIVCSCGFATTYTVLSNDAHQIGAEHFDRMHQAHIERLAQAEHPNIPSDLAPLREELEAVARTGGATVAAETCMGLIREVVRLREALRRIRENLFEPDKLLCIVNGALAAEPGEDAK